MNGRFLLDTNIVIACLGNEPSAVDRINDTDEFFISSTVLGEMLYGAYNSANVRGNVERINAFLSGAVLLTCDEFDITSIRRHENGATAERPSDPR